MAETVNRITKAQQKFRAEKRNSGCVRMQIWIDRDLKNDLDGLCIELKLTQEGVIKKALSKLKSNKAKTRKG